MTYDKLVYGKDSTEGVVGLEVTDDTAEMFIQNEDGSISSKTIPNRFWLLSNTNINGKFVKLQGDSYYKWGTQFTNRSDFQKMRTIWKNGGKDIYSAWNAEEALMIKDGITFYKGMRMQDLSLLSFDIETTGLDPSAPDAKVLLISTTYRNKNGSKNRLFSYDEYSSEAELLNDFSNYVVETNPSLIVGHNIISYDLPYLDTRASLCETTLNWGRNNSPIHFDSYNSKMRLDGTRDLLYKKPTIYGREIVDTFFLVTSFDVSKSFESHALKPLIKQLGLEKEGREFYDASLIRKNYKNPEEFKKIKQYAIDDAEDAIKIWDRMGGLYFNMAPMFPKPFTEILLSASGSKINGLMTRAYLQDKHSIPKADMSKSFQGALSWGKPGIYRNVKKVDAVSLYPSIIIQYEVYDQDKDPKAYLLKLVKHFRSARLEYKRLAAETNDSYWKELDTTAKGVLNSFYGFYGAQGLSFNSFECANFITGKGREILETAIQWATSKKLEEIDPEYYRSTSEGFDEEGYA